MAEVNPYEALSKINDSVNPYEALSKNDVIPEEADQEAALKQEYQKYQDPQVYEDTATPADLRKMSTTALDPFIALGPSGETGLTGLSKMAGLPTDRQTLAMGGALVGEAAGYKLAGTKGIAPGGVLGSGMASLTFDTLDGLIKFLQNDPEQELTPDIRRLGSQLGSASETMKDEMVAQSGGRAITKLFGGVKNMFSRFLGTNNPQAAELSSLATQFKVPLGIVQAIDKNKWAKGFTRVLGVLPYVSTPFKESTQKISESLGKNMHEMMDAFSPSINAAATVSEKIVNRANKSFDLFHARSDQLFNRWFKMADQLPPDLKAFIPTSKLKKAAQTVVDQFEAGKAGSRELRSDPLVEWARNALTFENKLTPQQFKGQMENLYSVMRESSEAIKSGANKNLNLGSGNIMKIAMESDLNSPQLNFLGSYKGGQKLPAGMKDPEAVTGAMIAQSFQRANTFFEKGLKRFETATAGKFRSVDRGAFKASFKEAGSQEQDQLFRKLFNMDSAIGIENLQQLVGKKNVLNGLRTVIDEAMEKAGDSLLDELPGPKALSNVRKALGIGTKNGELVLAQALKGSKVT